MDSIDFNHMFKSNLYKHASKCFWIQLIWVVFWGWNTVALISFERDEMFTYCLKTFHDRNAFGQIEARFGCLNDWVCMLDLIKQLLVFLLVHCVWLLHGSPRWLKGSESVLFSTRSLSEKSSYFLVVQNAPGLQIDDWHNSIFLEDK